MKTLFVTGGSGFVGRHLCEHVRTRRAADYRILEPPEGFDLRDRASVRAAFADGAPDAVVHLAAQSFVPASFDDPRGTWEVNVLGTLELVLALRAAGFGGRLLYVSSGDVYGRVGEDAFPITEAAPARPRNPYAASKLAAEELCLQWHRSDGLDVVVARPFNHIGPGQDTRFAVADFARQVAEIRLGLRPPAIDAGDVDVSRDFTDVEDVVRAYLMLIERGSPGETYNIASGRETRLRSVIETLCRLGGVAPELRQDPARLRRAEQRRVGVSSEKLRQATGWSAAVPIEESLARLMDHFARKSAQ